MTLKQYRIYAKIYQRYIFAKMRAMMGLKVWSE